MILNPETDPVELGERRRARAAAVREKIAANAARATMGAHVIQPHWVRTGEQIEPLLAEAAARAIAAYRGESYDD